MPEVIDYLSTYAERIAAPVECHTEVTSVRACDDGYAVSTTNGEWRAARWCWPAGRTTVPTYRLWPAGCPPA